MVQFGALSVGMPILTRNPDNGQIIEERLHKKGEYIRPGADSSIEPLSRHI